MTAMRDMPPLRFDALIADAALVRRLAASEGRAA